MPASYIWAPQAPSPIQLNEIISSNSVLWPQWDWRSLIEAGIQARLTNEPPAEAISRIRREFNIYSNNQMLVSSWLNAGLIIKSDAL